MTKPIHFTVGPAVRRFTLEPTTTPIRNVNTRRGKKRDRAKLNGLLQRLQAWVPGAPKKKEWVERIEIGSITPETIMETIVRSDRLIDTMYDTRCTHLLVGPDFHHSLMGSPFMQFNARVQIAVGVPEWGAQSPYRLEVFGFTVVVVPWMRGFVPIIDPGQWPKAVV